MKQSTKDQTLHFIVTAHAQLAQFARESYKTDGRGAIDVEFPALAPGSVAFVSTNMQYRTLDAMRLVLAAVDHDSREDANVLLRMIETYNPATQAVVTAAIEGENPVSMKMKLELLAVVDEPAGVH